MRFEVNSLLFVGGLIKCSDSQRGFGRDPGRVAAEALHQSQRAERGRGAEQQREGQMGEAC